MEGKTLKTSMAYGTMEAFDYVCHMDHAGKIADCPGDRKQKVATALLRDTIQKRNFAIPIVARASKAFGQVSRHLTAQILLRMSDASRTSRPGLVVGILRVLCNGMCAAQSFHMEGEEQRCRAGCQDEPDSLSHYNECPLLANFFTAVWRNAAILPRRGHLVHDLITQIFLRSLQYGIFVMGIIDAFVYAHNHHHRNADNPWNIGDCMGRKNPIYDSDNSTYQSICLAGPPLCFTIRNFAYPLPKPGVRIFPTL